MKLLNSGYTWLPNCCSSIRGYTLFIVVIRYGFWSASCIFLQLKTTISYEWQVTSTAQVSPFIVHKQIVNSWPLVDHGWFFFFFGGEGVNKKFFLPKNNRLHFEWYLWPLFLLNGRIGIITIFEIRKKIWSSTFFGLGLHYQITNFSTKTDPKILNKQKEKDHQ